MNSTPLAERISIVLYGLRNSGKSSLMNNIFQKEVVIVSDTPGTTTDPVTRMMELGVLGPVAITDTAGFDDVGELGSLRNKKTFERVDIANIILVVTRGDKPPQPEEIEFFDEEADKKDKIIVALTFADKSTDTQKEVLLDGFKVVKVNNLTGHGVEDLKKELIKYGKKADFEITPTEGLVQENDLVLLVTPIDLAAPKGRLILPQVETIRDLLDKDCGIMITKERELKYFYDALKIKPRLVITDSQAFNKVAADIPENQMLTSFSILFARKKGDLNYFIEGVKQLDKIKPNSKVLILESCSHHRQADDIGTVKIPRLFKQLVQSKVEFDFAKELPSKEKLKEYTIVVNCAGCMVTRNKMMQRLNILKENKIYGVNYGLFLAWVNGLLPRALEPFPEEFKKYTQN